MKGGLTSSSSSTTNLMQKQLIDVGTPHEYQTPSGGQGFYRTPGLLESRPNEPPMMTRSRHSNPLNNLEVISSRLKDPKITQFLKTKSAKTPSITGRTDGNLTFT